MTYNFGPFGKGLQTQQRGSTPSQGGSYSDLNEMVEKFFADPFGAILESPSRQVRRAVSEIRELKDGYMLVAEVPGIPKEDIEINVDGNVLTIRAESKQQIGSEADSRGYRRSVRSFQQSFSLPTTVDTNAVEAHCDNGVLEVFIPKTPESQPRKIQVQGRRTGDTSAGLTASAPETSDKGSQH